MESQDFKAFHDPVCWLMQERRPEIVAVDRKKEESEIN